MDVDFIILNVDNAADGFGVTPAIAEECFGYGADLLTGGNHLFHHKEIIPFISTNERLLRPLNIEPAGNIESAGNGFCEIVTAGGVRLLAVHLLGRTNMSLAGSDPFDCIDRLLDGYSLGKNIDVIAVDFHAEQAAEKNAFANYLDGRVSVIVGTHTHIPTADGRVLPGGTAYQTDIGMCGDYDSVIGMEKKSCIAYFVTKASASSIKSASGTATFSGVLVDVDLETGHALSLEPIILDGVLQQQGA
jgi:metallophosphoesterase (TIGR00282 family)